MLSAVDNEHLKKDEYIGSNVSTVTSFDFMIFKHAAVFVGQAYCSWSWDMQVLREEARGH